MAGMSQVVINILTTPLGAIAGLAGLIGLFLFAKWVFSEPQK